MRFLDPNLSRTADKLDEAKYFLDRMREHQTDAAVFRYNLSAFVSAARSVTLMMQSEFAKRAGFTKWYVPKRRDMVVDLLMKDLNNRRTTTIHKESIAFHPRVELNIRMVPVGSGEKGGAEVKYYFPDRPFPQEDIFTACQYQASYLERLVQECASLFGNVDTPQ
jgi:hypothetical protein